MSSLGKNRFSKGTAEREENLVRADEVEGKGALEIDVTGAVEREDGVAVRVTIAGHGYDVVDGVVTTQTRRLQLIESRGRDVLVPIP